MERDMKFCVAYINVLDNDLQQNIVEADGFFEAAIAAGHATEEDREFCGTYDDMQEYFFNGDSAIRVVEI